MSESFHTHAFLGGDFMREISVPIAAKPRRPASDKPMRASDASVQTANSPAVFGWQLESDKKSVGNVVAPTRRPTALDLKDAPDTELIEAAQAGNTHAFDALVRRYKSRVFMLAHQRTKSYEDALDITQETFVRAYLALPTWKPQASWYTWLYRITHNLCIDYHRARTRRRTESLDEPESTTPEPVTTDLYSSPDRVAEENELAGRIRQAMDELSDRQRDVFLLHHYGGLQVKEVAKTLDIAEGTAKIHLFRAVAKLRELLRPFHDHADA